MKDLVNLGKTIALPELVQRDAIHVACFPAYSNWVMYPGMKVSLVDGCNDRVIDSEESSIGIVDPFLNNVVPPGKWFWVLIKPYTITSLRHEWTHPAFENQVTAVNSSEQVRLAREFIERVASQVDMTFDEFYSVAKSYLETREYYCLGFDTPNILWNERIQIWESLSICTDLDIPDDFDEPFFWCAC